MRFRSVGHTTLASDLGTLETIRCVSVLLERPNMPPPLTRRNTRCCLFLRCTVRQRGVMLASSFVARRYARWHDRRPRPRRSWPFVAMPPTVRRTPARRSLRLSAGARWAPRRLSRGQSQSPALYPEQSHTPAAAAWYGRQRRAWDACPMGAMQQTRRDRLA